MSETIDLNATMSEDAVAAKMAKLFKEPKELKEKVIIDEMKGMKADKALKEIKGAKSAKDLKSKDLKEKVIKDEISKKSASKGKKGHLGRAMGNGSTKRKNGKRGELSFNSYIHKVLKQVHPNVGITKQGMSVMNDLVCNAFLQISEEAGRLVKMEHRDILQARDVNSAVRLILPGELAQHSNDEGSSALKHFESNTKKTKEVDAILDH